MISPQITVGVRWRRWIDFYMMLEYEQKVLSFLPEHDYVTFGSVCLSSERSCSYLVRWDFRQCFYAILYPIHRWPPCQILGDRPRVTSPSGLNAKPNRLLKMISPQITVGHVKDYISETVQDIGNHTRRIQWYIFGPSRMTPNKSSGP